MGSRDARDRQTWVVVELSRMGEQRAEEGTLADLFREALGLEADFPIFVPCVSYTRGGKLIVLNMMEGYAFVSTGLEEGKYISWSYTSPYVKQVMTQKSARGLTTLSTVTDDSLEEIRIGLRQMLAVELHHDMEVKVADGPYRGLSGIVVGMDEEYAHVLITMRSLKAIRRIPKIMLRPADAEDEDEDDEGDEIQSAVGDDFDLEMVGEEYV